MNGFKMYLDSLPAPLDKKTQNALLKQFYRTRDERIREILITHNLKLAAHCVLKFKSQKTDVDDWMQIATIELMNVLDNKFDINRGVDFVTFAYESIKLRLFDLLNTGRRSHDVLDQDNNEFVYWKGESSDKQARDIMEIVPDDENIAENFANKDFIARFATTLNEEERFILEHRFGINNGKKMTFQEIGEHFGKTRENMRQKTQVVIEKLKKFYNSQGRTANDKKIAALIEYVNADQDMFPDKQYVIESTFGLNNRDVISIAEIAQNLNCEESYVKAIILEALTQSRYFRQEILPDDAEKVLEKCENPREALVIEHTYGINGREPLGTKDICEKYQMKYWTVASIKDRVKKKVELNKLDEFEANLK